MILTDKEWKAFELTEIFEINSTSSGIDKNKLDNLNGNIPYITRTDKNNGVEKFIGIQTNKKWNRDSGNVITVGLDTQTVFYQPCSFYTGQNIQVLTNKNLNYYNAMFLIPLLKILMQKFSWGGNGATLTRLKKSKIMIPVNSEGNPDFNFMENYMKEKENKMVNKYVKYLETLDKLGGVTTSSKISWKSFKVSEVFELIIRGKRLKKGDHIDGNIPYVSSTMLNNGVDGFIGNEDARRFKDCLTIANSGSVGYSFYHPYEFIGSDHITALKGKENNKYTYLFMSSLLKRLSEKYSFNREINDYRINKEMMLLPVNEKEEIAYDYMEHYVKSIIKSQIEKYLNYKLV